MEENPYPAYPLQAVLACCNDAYCEDGSSSPPDTKAAKLSIEAAPQKVKVFTFHAEKQEKLIIDTQ